MYLSIQVCLFNLLFVILVSLALPCRTWRPLMSGVCTVWTCVVTVCKMLYQLNVVQPTKYSSNCTMVIVIIRRSEYTVYTALCFSLSALFHLSFFSFFIVSCVSAARKFDYRPFAFSLICWSNWPCSVGGALEKQRKTTRLLESE